MLHIGMSCGYGPSSHSPNGSPTGGSGSDAAYSTTHYTPILLAPSACGGLNNLAVCGGSDPLCSIGGFVAGGEVVGGGRAPGACTPVLAAAAVAGAAAPPLPQVTSGVVLTALRRIGLPSLEVRTQPEDKTLVNFDTIFYADPQTFSRTVTLLGRRVRIDATPGSFTWHYGDGSTASTTTPGVPYPSKDVTHSYTDAHATVQTSVDVTYSARFRVGDGAWQDIPGAVTITGPASPLRISEATAVLSGSYG